MPEPVAVIPGITLLGHARRFVAYWRRSLLNDHVLGEDRDADQGREGQGDQQQGTKTWQTTGKLHDDSFRPAFAVERS
ncbi:hypothetical protein C3L29_041760 [Pseudomonas sp. MWU12-2534b]|nr:hypothetical protein C3L29_041760 [Pseudomonas sp. MWU12-2534b]